MDIMCLWFILLDSTLTTELPEIKSTLENETISTDGVQSTTGIYKKNYSYALSIFEWCHL